MIYPDSHEITFVAILLSLSGLPLVCGLSSRRAR